mmetsp:Transcript_16944/g.45610  ORF Transcript_16944/g.45610 Transcript_16944/m.45610 type:complete len:116 (+) Transcript_16944:45-392(+)|eukprot:CAMPEP_0185190614 /NCGR_PEP_ID=MMETSP1140-20130426/11063_1 /TAXON_ID=298111 /ORGANISM="Pavlova sp., Strain CCMP459" /LENGTH=115 /DNA_ID=CAMNT_0027757273 /DNA_START=46 /DNA_END=393 /DNA_ORIENTATION=+
MSQMWKDEDPKPFRTFKRVADPPEDPSDRHALALAREQRSRDYLVAVEEMKMLQEQLSLCYLRAGVNAYTDCKDIAEAYAAKIRARNYGAPDPSGIKNIGRNNAAMAAKASSESE